MPARIVNARYGFAVPRTIRSARRELGPAATEAEMRIERWDFAGAQGSLLSGRLDLPDGAPRAYALFAHCFTCGKDILAARRIASGLAAHRIATLRFDFTGLGSSEGEFANTGFSSNVEDILAAVAALRAEGRAPALLVGHSLGGAAVLAAAGDAPEAKAVAVIGAPFAATHLLEKLALPAAELEATGTARVTIAGKSFTIRREFVEDLRRQNPAARIAQLHQPLLVLHAPEDSVVGIENARAIFEAARHPKSFIALDGADHLLSRPRDAAFVADILAAWLPRYLGPEEAIAQVPASAPGAATVVVEETRAGPFEERVFAGGQSFLADEPVGRGGGGAGPDPYDLLLAALGACTAMTLRLYADRKGLSLDKVRVLLDHRRIHAEDCDDCETREGFVEEITRGIALEGGLDAASRAHLLEIADRCPVHRTLTGEIAIRTREER
jgi:putative redox protein